VLVSLEVGDGQEVAVGVAAHVRGLGQLMDQLIAVTDLSLGQFSRLDRLRGA
jgi:hypothetical protein